LAAAAIPIVPPAPMRFSMTIGWPSCFCTSAKTVRGMMSVALPGVNGTIARIGRVGQSSASDDAQQAIRKKADVASHRRNISISRRDRAFVHLSRMR